MHVLHFFTFFFTLLPFFCIIYLILLYNATIMEISLAYNVTVFLNKISYLIFSNILISIISRLSWFRYCGERVVFFESVYKVKKNVCTTDYLPGILATS
jgi:hypothetical protein